MQYDGWAVYSNSSMSHDEDGGDYPVKSDAKRLILWWKFGYRIP